MRRWLSSLRARLLLLVLLAALPAFGVLFTTTRAQREAARTEAAAQAERLVALAAANHQRQIEDGRQLLATLAHLREVREQRPGACSRLFGDLLRQNPAYANLGVAAADGDVVCSAVPLDDPVNIGDRGYFRRAVETRAFAIGDYQIGRITGIPSLNFGFPLPVPALDVEGVVFAALDLRVMNRVAAQARLPEGGTLLVTDRAGTILARYPDADRWVGRSVPDEPVVRTILSRREGAAETTGLDGVPRRYAISTLAGGPGEDAFVAVGLPQEIAAAAATRSFQRGVVILILLVLATLAAAWVAGHVIVVRRVRRLVDTTRRLAGGELSARTGMASDAGELGELAGAFDDMAGSLQRRTNELAALTHSLEEKVEQRTLELGESNRKLAEAMEAVQRAYDTEREANRRLREVDELKTEFVAMVAHDLRSPMATITGFAEILRNHWARLPQSDREEFLDTIVRQVTGLADFVEDVLNVARIEAGEFSYDVRPFDLGALLDRTVEEIRAAHPSAQIDVSIPPGLPEALADERRNWQILTNLVSNAVKFSPEGAPVSISVVVRPGQLEVAVRDNGPGIAPHDLDKLFRKFSRIEPAEGQRGTKGAGLGLYMCKAMVEAQGGTIRVESTPGRGSTFAYTLPMGTGRDE